MADTMDAQPEILETPAVGTDSGTEPAPEEVDADALGLEDATLSDDARRARWQSRRPRILHLKEGIARVLGDKDPETGLMPQVIVPLFDVGDRVVVDCCTILLRPWLNEDGKPVPPWLETIVGKVRTIDDDTGLVTIQSEDGDPRNPPVRYANFKDSLFDFRLAPAKGNPFAASAVKPVRPPPAPGEERRGRGRPKGSKNRSKEEIEAEREAYRKMKEERKKGKR